MTNDVNEPFGLDGMVFTHTVRLLICAALIDTTQCDYSRVYTVSVMVHNVVVHMVSVAVTAYFMCDGVRCIRWRTQSPVGSLVADVA